MPMLKTAKPGTTSITNVKKYLEKERRQEHESHEEELMLFEQGKLQLPESQVGQLEGYLNANSRALAVDVSEDLPLRYWAQKMDATRAHFRHDRPTKKGTPRTYYHFILSPNMDDDCDLKTLRAYAVTWAEENLRSNGRLHEYAIVYHDDNVKGVPHAHIIANVSNKATGKKLHLSNKEVVRLGNSAQEIGKRFGLKPIRDDVEYEHVGVRTSQPIYLTRGERELLNKGKYSWKWELREVIWDTARRSRNYEDFKSKLRQLGYDVEPGVQTKPDEDAGLDENGKPIRKVDYEYLLYTHKNGRKVRDGSLGSNFYRESLEKEFTRDVLIEDQTYTPWEVIKITRGEIPWKEEIRRAIDQIAPVVLTIPELQEELERQFGIRLTVNRRGITYIHSSGFKVRDVSMGMRYTSGGLKQNAVVGEMAFPETGEEPRGKTATTSFYRDIAKMMERTGAVSLDGVAKALGSRYDELQRKKKELTEIQRELTECNRLAVILSRCENDRALLSSVEKEVSPDVYERALVRFERAERYLRDHVGDEDVVARQAALKERYEERLSLYQEHLDAFSKDQAIYTQYLERRGGPSVSPEAIFRISRTLSKYNVNRIDQLDRLISKTERHQLIAESRFHKADEKERRFQAIASDIRSYRDARMYLSAPVPNQSDIADLNANLLQARLKEASARLEAKGIKEGDFDALEGLYEEARKERIEMKGNLDEANASLSELKETKATCTAMQDLFRSLVEQSLDESKKEGSSATGDAATIAGEEIRKAIKALSEEPKPAVEDIPTAKARRTPQERKVSVSEKARAHAEELGL